jgi:hypothetical protein
LLVFFLVSGWPTIHPLALEALVYCAVPTS